MGALGIAQFMPATWTEASAVLSIGSDRRSAAGSIEAGAWYMARLRGQWRSERPERDRHSLALASYNGGLGNILAAQRACNDARLYPAIMQCLPAITGRHAAETQGYAPAIYRWWGLMDTSK